MKIHVKVFGRRAEMEWAFPARWEICPACDGHAVTTRHIEPDGGGFTASEWAEACHEDPDFAEDYRRGVYDRPCPHCKGLGRVKVIDEDYVTGWRDRIALKAYHAKLEDDANYEAMRRAERRMGA